MYCRNWNCYWAAHRVVERLARAAWGGTDRGIMVVVWGYLLIYVFMPRTLDPKSYGSARVICVGLVLSVINWERVREHDYLTWAILI